MHAAQVLPLGFQGAVSSIGSPQDKPAERGREREGGEREGGRDGGERERERSFPQQGCTDKLTLLVGYGIIINGHFQD